VLNAGWIEGNKLDRIFEAMPKYYALAIALWFAKHGGSQTRQSIMKEIRFQGRAALQRTTIVWSMISLFGTVRLIGESNVT